MGMTGIGSGFGGEPVAVGVGAAGIGGSAAGAASAAMTGAAGFGAAALGPAQAASLAASREAAELGLRSSATAVELLRGVVPSGLQTASAVDWSAPPRGVYDLALDAIRGQAALALAAASAANELFAGALALVDAELGG